MGHEIRYIDFDENKMKSEITKEADRVARKGDEYSHGLHRPIKFIEKVMSSYDDAREYLDSIYEHYTYPAVKYRVFSEDNIKNTTHKNKYLKLQEKVSKMYIKYAHLQNEKVSAEKEFITCGNCKSRINSNKNRKSYICPVCMSDMRPDGKKKKIELAKDEWKKAQEQLNDFKNDIANKNGEVRWLVLINYHV